MHSFGDRSGKTLLAVALLMAGTLTAAANVWGVKRINNRLLCRVGPQASELLGREVCTRHVGHAPPTVMGDPRSLIDLQYIYTYMLYMNIHAHSIQ